MFHIQWGFWVLQNVPPAVLIRFLREHRSEWADWADCEHDASCSDTLRTRVYGAAALAGAELGRREVPMPLAHSEHQEVNFRALTSKESGRTDVVQM